MTSAFKLAKFLKPYWRWAVLAPLLMLLEVMMDLMQPRMIQRVVDEGIANLDLNMVIHSGLLMVGLALVGAVGGIGCGIFAERAAVGFAADLREALFRKVQTFSFGYGTAHHAPDQRCDPSAGSGCDDAAYSGAFPAAAGWQPDHGDHYQPAACLSTARPDAD
jgi:ABC-type multidrug transport system fused ATPase/permease subunit